MLLANPFLGSGRGGPVHRTHEMELSAQPYEAHPVPSVAGPLPDPWRSDPVPVPWISASLAAPAVSYLASAISLRHIASRVPDARALAEEASKAIAEFIDDYCGTPPHPHPWFLVAAELAALGESLTESGLRREMLGVASLMIQAGFGAMSASPDGAPATTAVPELAGSR